jgi:pantoate--beta-alanine ligase
MQILRTIPELRQWSRRQRAAAQTIALVPTMGALHAGHASLIRAAAATCDKVAVSIFVNPTQFAPNEDYARYPRTFAADCLLAQSEGAHILFAPTVEELYPPNASTFVDVGPLSQRLDGQSRPGHFRGVATVVAKLLIAAEPDRAYFGQKDAAQVAILRRMTADLRFATEIVICPIVRDPDGLALSSRNLYLTPAQRTQALTLSRAIRKVESLAASGERRATKLIEAARQLFDAYGETHRQIFAACGETQVLKGHGFNRADEATTINGALAPEGGFDAEPAIRIDYIELVDWSTLEPVEFAAAGALFAIAAYVGPTRLIDNTVIL